MKASPLMSGPYLGPLQDSFRDEVVIAETAAFVVYENSIHHADAYPSARAFYIQ